ncbi:putative transcription factor C2H2 family [Helianthus anomalus]
MNNNNNNNITTVPTSNPPDLQLYTASPDPHVIFRPTLHTSDDPAWNVHPITTIQPHHQNPRKKRTKMIQFHNTKPIVTAGNGSGPSGTHSGVVTKKKPDPSAPKITRPCTECGKRFWSWKALFGHMRCHPERPWRGINPPPNIHHPPVDNHRELVVTTTEDDEYVAACLLMLANTPTVPQNVNTTTHASTSYQHQHHCGSNDMFPGQVNDPESRFECSSCKKVFGSHQALGGHRASHKNVKGCFANTRNDAGTGNGTGTEELEYGDYSSHCDKSGEALSINQQHKCSICLKIFSSGQALGGHKRCHLEKEDGGAVPTATGTATATTSVLSQPFRFDLNFPASLQDDSTCSSSDLDLRLRL